MASSQHQTLASLKNQMLCAWCGVAANVMWLVGFLWLAGFVPPLSPAASALEIQGYYRDHANMIRIGLCVSMMGAALIGPFTAAISVQMKRIEGASSPLTYTQLGMGMLNLLFFIVPCFLLGTAAFRPERDPQLIMLMNDAGWLPFVGAYQCFFFQLLSIAVCVLRDGEQKIFPRWVGMLNLWVALTMLPASFILFFKTGPFAWDGILAFWFVLVVFCSWFFVMFYQLRKTILNQIQALRFAA